MWELDYKESWVPKNWCFCTVVLEETIESPLDCEKIQQVHPKGNQAWIFIGRTDAEAETAILWPPDAKIWLIGKDPFGGKDWRWEENGMTEDGWDGWMASPTQWTWVWVNSGSWGWTGWPGMLQSMGSQRVGHDWVTELNWLSNFVNGNMANCKRISQFSLPRFVHLVMGSEAWHAAVHGVSKSQTWLSDWTELSPEIQIIWDSALIF